MASTTGIELGPDSCVLVAVRPARKGVADVMALHIIEPSSWPGQDVVLAETLKTARRAKRFPRRARVVAWGLPDRPTIDDPITHALLRPFTAAGFRVRSVLTPPEALALLAASRPRTAVGEGNTVAWLALNVHAVAIAIVSAGELIFARTFGWSYNSAAMSGKAQLLQRYSLVAQLAPEVRRGIAAVRESHGITVDGIVTCGDLPELRSLTMPLIEELDLEVETLDSTEGLQAAGKARVERFAESAPALRLACAAALAGQAAQDSAVRSVVRVAAALAVIAALGWGGYAYWRGTVVRPVTTERGGPPKPAAVSAARRGAPPQAPAGRPSTPPRTNPAPEIPASPPGRTNPAPGTASIPPPTNPARGAPAGANVPARETVTTQRSPATAATPAPVRPANPAASVPSATIKPAPPPPPKVELKPLPSTSAKVELRPLPSTPAPAEPRAAPSPPAKSESRPLPAPGATAPPVTPPLPKPTGPPAVTVPRNPDSKPAASASRQVGLPPSQVESPLEPSRATNRRLVPLKDPLPRVDSILIDQERRLAIIAGTIVTIGDAVGPRVVVQIDRDGVVLREPSGLTVRITVRSAMPG